MNQSDSINNIPKVYVPDQTEKNIYDFSKNGGYFKPSVKYTKKAFVKKGLNSNVKMLCKKDTTPIAYGSGYVIPEYSYYVDGDFTKEKIIHNNMFCFNFVIMSNVYGNKNWVRTAEFFQAIKDYVVSQHSVNGIVIDAVKGKSVAVAFKQAQADGVCPGTYSVNGNGSTDSLIWIY